MSSQVFGPVPEQSAVFMSRLSGGDVSHEGGYLFLSGPDWLMGIGYPEDGVPDTTRFENALAAVRRRTHAHSLQPVDFFVIAPDLPASICSHRLESDVYYILPSHSCVPAALRGPVRKAASRLHVDETRKFTAQHRRLWAEFLGRTPLNARIRRLYAATESLLGTDADVRLLNAWDGEGHLAACMVLEYGLPDCVSYIIGAHSRTYPAPHASDLLFAVMLERAKTEEKTQILLGLGVNDGIRRFKRKWGGVPAQKYELAMWREGPSSVRQPVDAMMTALLATSDGMSKRQIFASLPPQRPFAMLWRLEKNGRTSWIGGSAHFFCCSFEHSLRNLFERVDSVLLEGPLDPDSLDAVERHGRNPGPDEPRVVLDEADVRGLEHRVNGAYPRLAALLNAAGPPPVDVRERLEKTRPWYAFFSLWTAYLERHGWAYSVDMEAWNLALDMGKSVLGMESLTEQIASLESAPLPRITRFLQNWRRWGAFRRRNEKAYLRGELENMMGTSAEFPTRTEQIIDRRDQRFRERMRPYIENGGAAVFVGSAHMLNLRHMLAADGFTVIREFPTWKHRLRGVWQRNCEKIILPSCTSAPADNRPMPEVPVPTWQTRSPSGIVEGYGGEQSQSQPLLGSGESLSWLTSQAKVPEQVLPYVRAISDARLSECGGFALWQTGSALVLAGFESDGMESEPADFSARLNAAVQLALRATAAERITVLSTEIPACAPRAASVRRDAWWGVDLPVSFDQKLRNMIRRGHRDVRIEPERWTPEHAEIVEWYLRERPLSPGTRSLFSRLAGYAATPGALLLSARGADGTLVAFLIGEMSGLKSALYLFAFRRPECPPGVADALLAVLADEAAKRGHTQLNLGLGINPGIAFFKRKWRAVELFPQVETSWTVERECF